MNNRTVYQRYQCSEEVYLPVKLQFIIWGWNGIFALIFNSISIILIATNSKLQKNPFLVLILGLSISSTGLSVCMIFISAIVLACDYNEELTFDGGCVAGMALLKAMQLCSTFHTLVICIFQYSSTFTTMNDNIKRFTSWRLVPVWHIIIMIYIFIVFYSCADVTSFDCNEDIFFGENWIRASCFTYIPLLSTFILVIIVYGMTVSRLLRNHKRMVALVGKRELSEKRLRHNVITMGLFICLTILLVLPKFATLVIICCGFDGFQLIKFVSGVVCGFKPLMDPVVYTLRIEEIRNSLKITCKLKRSNRIDQFQDSGVTTTDTRTASTGLHDI